MVAHPLPPERMHQLREREGGGLRTALTNPLGDQLRSPQACDTQANVVGPFNFADTQAATERAAS